MAVVTKRFNTSTVLRVFAWSLALVTGIGCRHPGPRNPEDLHAAYLDALRKDDPDAAYQLLSPELQARIDADSFRARWQANAKERKMALDAAEARRRVDGDAPPAVRGAQSTHEGGHTLVWTQAGDSYLVVSGLPGIPDTSTPEATVRTLIAALRRANDGELGNVLAPELRERAASEWQVRVESIESALAEPGSVTYSADNMRAILRYAAGRAIVLEQSPAGWRVIEMR